MAKTQTNVTTPVVDATITEPKPSTIPSDVKYALSITCICGGRYVPLTHKVSDTKNVFYRCTKCGKDINVKLTPVNK